MTEHELLDERIVEQHGRLERVRRWWRGAHPKRGVITMGLTGWETMQEAERIRSLKRFSVRAANSCKP